jgi:hypothetical protein
MLTAVGVRTNEYLKLLVSDLADEVDEEKGNGRKVCS